MARSVISLIALVIMAAFSSAQGAAKGDVTSLQIGVKFKPEICERQAKSGDNVHVHYTGKLTDGTKFDSSLDRGEPIVFELGQGRVIQGWDQGILGMCIGEKRKLRIPPALGYGDSGAPPTIPGGATLVFDTELVKID
eukprot:CAMPEP_0119105206 /NCGR_PEP_ID=MMETSP1180-20130426/3238_1 /TAXON_ID=3052 ORGANISM="Chlamydomonas cf sp, Strain CCMP681" /NCGR_SAMPLE_ID=MMETSP1180 /ASSEMBLY_ACC=CAM_ASM_000741 /LENGTH=137 /DNA_ID=CAMNT_0007090209 /DNA_START=33 /DNA_END=446 /DNA_ORIENTATION=-